MPDHEPFPSHAIQAFYEASMLIEELEATRQRALLAWQSLWSHLQLPENNVYVYEPAAPDTVCYNRSTAPPAAEIGLAAGTLVVASSADLPMPDSGRRSHNHLHLMPYHVWDEKNDRPTLLRQLDTRLGVVLGINLDALNSGRLRIVPRQVVQSWQKTEMFEFAGPWDIIASMRQR